MIDVRSIADIRAIEQDGFDSLCPQAAPYKIIATAARTWPDHTAIHYLTDATDPAKDQRWSYRELADDVTAAGRAFRAIGVSSTQSVAIICNHTPLAQIALWGAQLAGRACPINPLSRPEQIAKLLKAADVAAVVMMGVNSELDYWSTLVPALRAAGVSVPIYDCDADAPSTGSAGSFEALIAAERGQPLGFEIDGDDTAIAALYHTSGTTGVPKLVQHTRRNQAHVARSCAVLHGLGPEDVVVNGFPLFHVAGAFVYGLSVLSAGGTILIPGRLGMRNTAFTGKFWQQAARIGITVISAVPTLLSGLLGRAIDADVSQIRAALTGGSPLPPELAERFTQTTGIPVRNIFGMSETAGAIALESIHADATPHCCGFPLPFSEVAILPHGSGETDPSAALPVGETGIVVVRGPNVSPGYTEASRNVGTFLDGGWLVTGDLGRLDKEGRLYLTGRAKDVIIRGSHNIDPQSIEDALLSHPDVEIAAAVGMPDNYAGELPVAFVTLRDGATATLDDILAVLQTRIEEPAAMPKRVEFIDTMPMTAVGKIFKPQLRQKATRWAILAAAHRAGLPEGSYLLEVDDALKVTLSADAQSIYFLKEQTVGMPISIHFQTTAEHLK